MILKQDLHGDNNVPIVKLQTLYRDFGIMFMKESEYV